MKTSGDDRRQTAGGRAAMPGGAPRGAPGGESPVRAANGRRIAGPGGDLPADRRATRQAPASAGRLAANAARPVYRRQSAARPALPVTPAGRLAAPKQLSGE